MQLSQIISIVVAAGGVGLVVYGLRTHARAVQSANWPSVTGKIVTCRLHAEGDDDEPDKWRVEVAYEYEVDNVPFTGSTVAPDQDRPTVRGNEALLVGDRFPLHGRVQVYYDPMNASQAVLEPGETKYALTMMGVGALLLVGGIIAALRYSQ